MTHQIRFAALSPTTMAALLADDLTTAAPSRVSSSASCSSTIARSGCGTTGSSSSRHSRRRRIGSLAGRARRAEPGRGPGEVVVGYAGYHGPPDENGMVEVGYTRRPAVPAAGLREGDPGRIDRPGPSPNPQYGWFARRSARTTSARSRPSPRSASPRTATSGTRRTASS